MPGRLLALLLLSISAPVVAGDSASRDLEMALAKSLHAVGENHLDVALNEVDSLLKINPNFKLAQLVRGDLLMARSRPLSDFGNAPNAPNDRVQDLRDEASARIARVRNYRPVSVPKYLVAVAPGQRYAVVVDTAKSTLYLFENVNGEPRYVTDFYITLGKNGTDKPRGRPEDAARRLLRHRASARQAPDFYGSGAYPDQLSQRMGQAARPQRPRHLAARHALRHLQPPAARQRRLRGARQRRPDAARQPSAGRPHARHHHEQMEWSDEADRAERAALPRAIEHWRNDWESLDTERYLAHYARDFPRQRGPGRVRRAEAPGELRQDLDQGQTVQSQRVPLPQPAELVVVNFEQDYGSNNLSNRMHKRQYWMKRDGRWQIVYEGAA